MLVGLFLFTAYKYNTYNTKPHAEKLPNTDMLLEYEQSNDQQHAGKSDVCDKRAEAYLPACPVKAYAAEFQGYNGKTEYN